MRWYYQYCLINQEWNYNICQKNLLKSERNIIYEISIIVRTNAAISDMYILQEKVNWSGVSNLLSASHRWQRIIHATIDVNCFFDKLYGLTDFRLNIICGFGPMYCRRVYEDRFVFSNRKKHQITYNFMIWLKDYLYLMLAKYLTNTAATWLWLTSLLLDFVIRFVGFLYVKWETLDEQKAISAVEGHENWLKKPCGEHWFIIYRITQNDHSINVWSPHVGNWRSCSELVLKRKYEVNYYHGTK